MQTNTEQSMTGQPTYGSQQQGQHQMRETNQQQFHSTTNRDCQRRYNLHHFNIEISTQCTCTACFGASTPSRLPFASKKLLLDTQMLGLLHTEIQSLAQDYIEQFLSQFQDMTPPIERYCQQRQQQQQPLQQSQQQPQHNAQQLHDNHLQHTNQPHHDIHHQQQHATKRPDVEASPQLPAPTNADANSIDTTETTSGDSSPSPDILDEDSRGVEQPKEQSAGQSKRKSAKQPEEKASKAVVHDWVGTIYQNKTVKSAEPGTSNLLQRPPPATEKPVLTNMTSSIRNPKPFQWCPDKENKNPGDNKIRRVVNHSTEKNCMFLVEFEKKVDGKPFMAWIHYLTLLDLEPHWKFLDYIRGLYLFNQSRFKKIKQRIEKEPHLLQSSKYKSADEMLTPELIKELKARERARTAFHGAKDNRLNYKRGSADSAASPA